MCFLGARLLGAKIAPNNYRHLECVIERLWSYRAVSRFCTFNDNGQLVYICPLVEGAYAASFEVGVLCECESVCWGYLRSDYGPKNPRPLTKDQD